MWKIFRRTPAPLQKVMTTGRFEIEQNGETASYLRIIQLERECSWNLIHTEIPESLRPHRPRVFSG